MQRPSLGCLCELCQKSVGGPGPQVIDAGSLQSGQLVYLCDVENVELGRKALGTELCLDPGMVWRGSRAEALR